MYKKKKLGNNGQALVEFALLLPLLLLLLCGIVEFGRLFSAALTVSHSAREGARLGAVGVSDTEIINRVKASAPVLNGDNLIVEITPSTVRERGQEIIVTVSYPVNVVVPLITAFTGDTVTVSSASIMRVE